MPELESLYQELKADNINLIGVASDSGEGEEQEECFQDKLPCGGA